jgi:5-methylthioadenosine/S-adenosylhomocysteine deaminase
MRLFCSFLLFITALAAESADWIWTGRYVVTMDPQRRVIENGAIAIRGARILAAGPRAEIARQYQAQHELDRPDAIIAPGLISTHTHAAMSLFRGVADDLRLQDWLEHYIFPAEARNVTPDFVRWGTRLGALEMLLSGTTTFTDMYYFAYRARRGAACHLHQFGRDVEVLPRAGEPAGRAAVDSSLRDQARK